MNMLQRPLAGLTISISISESADSPKLGYPSSQINWVTLKIVEALLGQGARIGFGHDWRDDGVMEAIHGFALRTQLPESSNSGASLLNVLPWPDKPFLSLEERSSLGSSAEIFTCGLPPGLSKFSDSLPEKDGYNYLRARSLTYARYILSGHSQARLCIGGRTAGFQGRYPGITEEALLSLENQVPLYLAGTLGGATLQLVEAIRGKAMPPDFCPGLERLMRLYQSPPFPEAEPLMPNHCKIDRVHVWEHFKADGITALSYANGLTEAENNELFDTPVLDRVIELVLKGLSRISKRNQKQLANVAQVGTASFPRSSTGSATC